MIWPQILKEEVTKKIHAEWHFFQFRKVTQCLGTWMWRSKGACEIYQESQIAMTYGIMSMPGLVVNEKVVLVGKVLKLADIEKLFHKHGF